MNGQQVAGVIPDFKTSSVESNRAVGTVICITLDACGPVNIEDIDVAVDRSGSCGTMTSFAVSCKDEELTILDVEDLCLSSDLWVLGWFGYWVIVQGKRNHKLPGVARL